MQHDSQCLHDVWGCEAHTTHRRKVIPLSPLVLRTAQVVLRVRYYDSRGLYRYFLGCILSTFLESRYNLIKCFGIIISRHYANRACPEKTARLIAFGRPNPVPFLFRRIIAGKPAFSKFFRIRNCPSAIDPLSILPILSTSHVGSQICKLQIVFFIGSFYGHRDTLIWE